jgi:hypothetical protein
MVTVRVTDANTGGRTSIRARCDCQPDTPSRARLTALARGYQALFASLAIAVPHMTPGATLHPPNDRCYYLDASARGSGGGHCAYTADSNRLSWRPWVRNFSKYLAQRAADSHIRPVPAGHTIVSQHGRWAALPTATPQVRARMSTSSPGWATMHRVSRRCSSVGRAAVL